MPTTHDHPEGDVWVTADVDSSTGKLGYATVSWVEEGKTREIKIPGDVFMKAAYTLMVGKISSAMDRLGQRLANEIFGGDWLMWVSNDSTGPRLPTSTICRLT